MVWPFDKENGKRWMWFKEDEVVGLDPRLVAMLDNARSVSMVPYKITSGFRSPEDNAGAGGVSGSSHTKGLGVDLACDNSSYRFKMIVGLLTAGFTRIGVYDKHLHADCDNELPQEVVWVGISK